MPNTPFRESVSFFPYATTSSHVAGGFSGSRPAALKSVLL